MTPIEINCLAKKYGSTLTPLQITELVSLTGGHPYLTSIAFKYLARGYSWQAFQQIAPTNAAPYGNYLRQLLKILQRNPKLGRAFAEVVSDSRAIALPVEIGFKLVSLGLVEIKKNCYSVQNNLYRQYFLTHIKELEP